MLRLQQQLLLLSGCAKAAAQDAECPEDSMRQPANATKLIWPDVEGDTRSCGDLMPYGPYFSDRTQPGTSQPRECQSFDNPTSDCDYSGCDQPDECSVDISGSWCFDASATRVEVRCGGCGVSCSTSCTCAAVG